MASGREVLSSRTISARVLTVLVKDVWNYGAQVCFHSLS